MSIATFDLRGEPFPASRGQVSENALRKYRKLVGLRPAVFPATECPMGEARWLPVCRKDAFVRLRFSGKMFVFTVHAVPGESVSLGIEAMRKVAKERARPERCPRRGFTRVTFQEYQTMCQNQNSMNTGVGASTPASETITLTIDQLEDILEGLMPSASEVLAGVSRATDLNVGVLWEKCGPCIAGFKACLKCSWTGCKVRLRRC